MEYVTFFFGAHKRTLMFVGFKLSKPHLLLKLDALSDMGKLESVKLWEQYTNEIIGEEVKLIDAGTIVQKNFHNCSYYISK